MKKAKIGDDDVYLVKRVIRRKGDMVLVRLYCNKPRLVPGVMCMILLVYLGRLSFLWQGMFQESEERSSIERITQEDSYNLCEQLAWTLKAV